MAVMLYDVKFEGVFLGPSTLVLLLAVKPSLIPFVLKVALVSGVFVLVGLYRGLVVQLWMMRSWNPP